MLQTQDCYLLVFLYTMIKKVGINKDKLFKDKESEDEEEEEDEDEEEEHW